jgi:16S rRNA (cytidine1402-2'-O)-methyltransferase
MRTGGLAGKPPCAASSCRVAGTSADGAVDTPGSVTANTSAGGGVGSGGGFGSGCAAGRTGGAGSALVFAEPGAHNPPGASQNGVLQPLASATAAHSSDNLTLFILPPMTAQEFSSIATLPVMGEMAHQTYPSATLYVVATPIGNVTDISLRALHVLSMVNAVACEDTRNTAQLMTRFGLHQPLIAAHQHNEREVAETLIARLQAGERIALVSDAGTPAVSDPGARIVDAVRAAGLRVLPLPGASAAVTALSASGLVNDQFYFVGFLPAKAKQRENFLGTLRAVTATMVFYEAPHRILDCATALAAVFEPERQVVFARELTKMFEEIHRCPLSEAEAWIKADPHREKGEFVVLLEGAPAAEDEHDLEAERVLKILLTECSVKQAANLAAQITGRKKNALYDRALQLKGEE